MSSFLHSVSGWTRAILMRTTQVSECLRETRYVEVLLCLNKKDRLKTYSNSFIVWHCIFCYLALTGVKTRSHKYKHF